MKEIVFTIGLPASGKSKLRKDYEGYQVFSRDDMGGTLQSLHKKLAKYLKDNKDAKVFVDNTYVTQAQRAELVQVGKDAGARIEAIWVNTPLQDCQFNACFRKETGGREVPLIALFSMNKRFEEPSKKEGFALETVGFTRVMPKEYVNKALILDYDGTVRTNPSGAGWPSKIADIQLIPGVAEKIKAYRDIGYLLLGASNQAPIAYGEFSSVEAQAMFDHTNKLLGLDIDVQFCPNKPNPLSYDRKPYPGMGVRHIVKHKLLPWKCVMVGDSTSDEQFAKRCGFKFIHADKF